MRASISYLCLLQGLSQFLHLAFQFQTALVYLELFFRECAGERLLATRLSLHCDLGTASFFNLDLRIL